MTPAHLSRRSMLIAAAAAAGASWFDVPKVLAAADSTAQWTKKYGGFPMGIQSYTLRDFGVDEAIDITGGELGLHRIEFFPKHYPIDSTPEQIAAMNKKLAKWDMGLSSHGVNHFGKDHAKNEALFKFAKAAGLKTMSADFETEAHDSLSKLVAQYDIKLACHNHGPSHRWKSPEGLLEQIGSLDPRIGACADLGHYIRSSQDPVEVIHKLKGRLWGIHLKDFAEAKEKTTGVLLGKGHLDVVGVFKALKAVNFPADGALSLEYEENPKDHPKLLAEVKENFAIAAEAAQKVA